MLVAAGNRPALDQWFGLGFGKQQAYGIISLADYHPPQTQVAGLTIRQATADDKAIAERIATTNMRYQMGSPTFAVSPPEHFDEVREGYVEALTDDAIFWLAFVDGEIAGYHIDYPAQADDTDMMQPTNCIEFPAGATLPGRRGQGIGTALTRHALSRAKAAGYDYCLTDWRTTNPLSSRFWPQMGFVPVVYRLTRHIDERIAWAAAVP